VSQPALLCNRPVRALPGASRSEALHGSESKLQLGYVLLTHARPSWRPPSFGCASLGGAPDSSRNQLVLALLPRVCAAIKTAKPARRDHGRARAGEPMRRALAVRRLLTPPSGGAGSAAVLPAFRSSEGGARSRLAGAGSAAGFRSRYAIIPFGPGSRRRVRPRRV
jgi:hypothetical protein